jgi:serine/threonine protein phosphatase PrpC
MKGKLGEYPTPTREQKKIYEGKEGLLTRIARTVDNAGLRQPAQDFADFIGAGGVVKEKFAKVDAKNTEESITYEQRRAQFAGQIPLKQQVANLETNYRLPAEVPSIERQIGQPQELNCPPEGAIYWVKDGELEKMIQVYANSKGETKVSVNGSLLEPNKNGLYTIIPGIQNGNLEISRTPDGGFLIINNISQDLEYGGNQISPILESIKLDSYSFPSAEIKFENTKNTPRSLDINNLLEVEMVLNKGTKEELLVKLGDFKSFQPQGFGCKVKIPSGEYEIFSDKNSFNFGREAVDATIKDKSGQVQNWDNLLPKSVSRKHFNLSLSSDKNPNLEIKSCTKEGGTEPNFEIESAKYNPQQVEIPQRESAILSKNNKLPPPTFSFKDYSLKPSSAFEIKFGLPNFTSKNFPVRVIQKDGNFEIGFPKSSNSNELNFIKLTKQNTGNFDLNRLEIDRLLQNCGYSDKFIEEYVKTISNKHLSIIVENGQVRFVDESVNNVVKIAEIETPLKMQISSVSIPKGYGANGDSILNIEGGNFDDLIPSNFPNSVVICDGAGGVGEKGADHIASNFVTKAVNEIIKNRKGSELNEANFGEFVQYLSTKLTSLIKDSNFGSGATTLIMTIPLADNKLGICGIGDSGVMLIDKETGDFSLPLSVDSATPNNEIWSEKKSNLVQEALRSVYFKTSEEYQFLANHYGNIFSAKELEWSLRNRHKVKGLIQQNSLVNLKYTVIDFDLDKHVAITASDGLLDKVIQNRPVQSNQSNPNFFRQPKNQLTPTQQKLFETLDLKTFSQIYLEAKQDFDKRLVNEPNLKLADVVQQTITRNYQEQDKKVIEFNSKNPHTQINAYFSKDDDYSIGVIA